MQPLAPVLPQVLLMRDDQVYQAAMTGKKIISPVVVLDPDSSSLEVVDLDLIVVQALLLVAPSEILLLEMWLLPPLPPVVKEGDSRG